MIYLIVENTGSGKTTYSNELKTHFLDISKEIRFDRVMKRNREKGATFEFEVSKDDFDFMQSWFEKPNETEMASGITVIK